MDVKKLDNSDTGNVSGGRSHGIFDRVLYYTIENVCKVCGKKWEYKQSRFKNMPNWATGPWCPACRVKLYEEALEKEEVSKKTKQSDNV